jgi:hypothetical protein
MNWAGKVSWSLLTTEVLSLSLSLSLSLCLCLYLSLSLSLSLIEIHFDRNRFSVVNNTNNAFMPARESAL